MKKMLDFKDAHRLILRDIQDKNISCYNEWQNKYIKSPDFPHGVPKQPQITYKNKGWVSWGHWLGTGNVSNVKKRVGFLSYEDAKEWIKKDVKKYEINSKNKWFNNYASSKLIPNFIPSYPYKAYKCKGWVSWGDWLGTKNRSGGFHSRKYVINYDFFSQWSEDMAYILGFWYADGCIKDNRRFSIYQHKKDKYLLRNMLNAMSSDYPIHDDKRDCCYFEVSSRKICDDVKEIGGICRKSLTMSLPLIPQNFFKAFVRGYFDGDGCITYDSCSSKYMSYITSGSKKMLIQIKDELGAIDIKGNINNQCSIKFSALNTIKLGEFMYNDIDENTLKLNRKYEKFKLAGAKI